MAGDGLFITQVDLGIKSIQLASGESIIGRVWYNESKSEYDVENPVSPQVRQHPDGRINVSLGPLRPWLKDVARQTLDKSHVAYISDVGEQMEGAYRQLTSDIQVASPADLSSLLSAK